MKKFFMSPAFIIMFTVITYMEFSYILMFKVFPEYGEPIAKLLFVFGLVVSGIMTHIINKVEKYNEKKRG